MTREDYALAALEAAAEENPPEECLVYTFEDGAARRWTRAARPPRPYVVIHFPSWLEGSVTWQDLLDVMLCLTGEEILQEVEVTL